jgi:hypothetical protein
MWEDAGGGDPERAIYRGAAGGWDGKGVAAGICGRGKSVGRRSTFHDLLSDLNGQWKPACAGTREEQTPESQSQRPWV